MLRWTTSHQIPIDLENNGIHRTHMFTFRSEIFIVVEKSSYDHNNHERRGQIEMFTFKPDIGQVQKVECPFSSIRIAEIHTISCSEDDVYIWACGTFWRHMNGTRFTLYKLDMKTMQFERIVSMISPQYYLSHTPIIADIMYVIDGDRDELIREINLKIKTIVENYVVRKPVKTPQKFRPNIMANDNKLYMLLRSTVNNERIVSILVGRNALYSAKDEYGGENVGSEDSWTNGSVFNIHTEKEENYGSLDTFDFDEMKWHRHYTEKGSFINYNAAILAFLPFKNNIYAIFRSCGFERTETLEIRVMETAPNLSTICLHGVVKEVLNDASGQSLEYAQQLPLVFDTKQKLGNMLKWRLAEKETREKYKLYKQQCDGILNELHKMCREKLMNDDLYVPIVNFMYRGMPNRAHLVRNE